MQAASLEALEKADASTALARALAQVFEFEFAARKDDLAMKKDIGAVRGEIAEVRGEVANLRSEMGQLRHGIESGSERLQGKMQTLIGNLTRQIYMALITQTTAFLGFIYFVVSQTK